MKLTVLQLKYLEINLSIFGVNAVATQEQRDAVYDIYNALTKQKKKPNSCGRCWRNVKGHVYKQYLKQKEE